MSIFEYKKFGDPKDIGDNPYSSKCIYCGEKLKTTIVEDDIWETNDDELLSIHQETKLEYKEMHGLEDCYLNLDLESKSTEEIWVNYCDTCGWWRLVKDVCISAEVWQMWDIFFGCSGVLRNLKIEDISTPLNEVSKYLIAKYESRFSVNPYLFERVVASIFKDFGHHVHVTGYSNDGGIDVVLGNNDDNMIGVQVKRYKGKIKVEQIRSFAGALLLAGYTKGIFVTTSSFQPGAYKAAKQFSSKTFPIELINADKFYDALKISQKSQTNIEEIINHLQTSNLDRLYTYGMDTPRNSL